MDFEAECEMIQDINYKDGDAITVIDCDSAEQFWDVLSPQKILKGGATDFIYRGQRDAKWQLLLSVLRDEGPVVRISPERRENCANRFFLEMVILKEFVSYCDRTSLRIPTDSMEFREKYLDVGEAADYSLKPNQWPPKEIWEVMALAQHHGVPTRLLDWSRRSYVAAYFAASDVLTTRANDRPERMAVWAFDVESHRVFENISVVRVPGSTSTNLAAQVGVFTLVREEETLARESYSPNTLEKEIQNHPNLLWKITVPAKEASNILDLCQIYAVSGATLFPGFDGAARSVLDFVNSAEFEFNK